MNFDRRVTPFRPDLADEGLRGQVEAERFASGTAVRVVAPSAPVRRHPSPDAPLDTEALMGEMVTIYDEHEGFAWGQLRGDGYVGYLPTEALGPPGPAPAGPHPSADPVRRGAAGEGAEPEHGEHDPHGPAVDERLHTPIVGSGSGGPDACEASARGGAAGWCCVRRCR